MEDKQKFMDKVSDLYDACDKLNITINIERANKQVPLPTTVALADSLAALRDARTIPFDIPVLAARDIQLLPEFKGHSKRAIAGALSIIGCVYIGKDFATATGKTSLWWCFDSDRIVPLGKKAVTKIYSRTTVWE